MTVTGLQIFGTKKCADTRRAERFFSDRGIKYQFIDLAAKGMAAGELRSVAARAGGFENLINREGKRYQDKGMQYRAPTGPRIEQALLDDPLLINTPVVRSENRATVGFCDEIWLGWL